MMKQHIADTAVVQGIVNQMMEGFGAARQASCSPPLPPGLGSQPAAAAQGPGVVAAAGATAPAAVAAAAGASQREAAQTQADLEAVGAAAMAAVAAARNRPPG